MQFNTWDTDEALLEELGRRLAACRLAMGVTQSALAFEAGISKRTLERIEAGVAVQTTSLVRMLRALRLIENLEALAPSPVQPAPSGKQRRRAPSTPKKSNASE